MDRLLRKWLRTLLNACLPERVWRQVREELRLLSLRMGNRYLPWQKRRYQRFKKQKGLLVCAGGGPEERPGWINLDKNPYQGVDLVGDMRDRLPFETGSVKAIHMEHILEHLAPYTEARFLLRECYRVLSPNGRLRIIVPEGGLFLKAYVSADRSFLVDRINAIDWRVTMSEKGTPLATPMESINEVCRQSGKHCFLYDFETLALRLEEAGFLQIERSSCMASLMPELRIDLEWRAAESLYVEAVR